MKHILVAVDSAEDSRFVVEQAVLLARVLGAKMRLMNAVNVPAPMPAPPGAFVVPVVPMAGELIAGAAESLKKLLELVPPELRDTSQAVGDAPATPHVFEGGALVVEVGRIAETIRSIANAFDTDVVVIGAHHHNVLARALGTKAARIIDTMDRSVFVVRPPAQA